MDDSLVKEMASVLRGYELWEADLVLCHEAWDTITGLPKLTQELYDKLLELQSRRNAVLERLGARN